MISAQKLTEIADAAFAKWQETEAAKLVAKTLQEISVKMEAAAADGDNYIKLYISDMCDDCGKNERKLEYVTEELCRQLEEEGGFDDVEVDTEDKTLTIDWMSLAALEE